MSATSAVYVYGIVRSERPPVLARAPAGLPHTGPLRVAPAGRDLWVLLADAPLSRYGSEAIERGLRDLDWVSRCAVAHEQVLRHFARRKTTVPLRLFTLFRGDDRALADVRGKGKDLSRVLSRIEGCEEWGARIVATGSEEKVKAPPSSGAGAGRRFLEHKQALRRRARRVAAEAPRSAAAIVRALARLARAHRRLPIVTAGGRSPLLADVAFLVPRQGRRAFRRAVMRAAAAGKQQGVRVTLSGPWPPYNFVDGAR
jgi:hypothetical protein